MYDINDKVAFITGGAAGIGAGVVKAFLEEGAKHVTALDVDVKSGEALQKELDAKYGENKFKFIKCDVTTDELIQSYDAVIKDLGYIDIVVNCAGILNDSRNVYVKQIAVNVTALITSTLKAYDLMRGDHGGKGGTIINISSVAALFQGSTIPINTATKSAVFQFSNCLGNEFHYNRSGVRILTICFGCTETTLFDAGKMQGIDDETNQALFEVARNMPFQKPESAVKGLVEAFKKGDSGSTWLVTSERPAEDITGNVKQAYDILSRGIFS